MPRPGGPGDRRRPRGRRLYISKRQTPRSRWRQLESTGRTSWRCGVENEQSGADQPAAAQRDLHDHAVRLKDNVADMYPIKEQQRRECGGGAHGTIDLQFAGFSTRESTADPVRVSGPPLHRCKAPAHARNRAAR